MSCNDLYQIKIITSRKKRIYLIYFRFYFINKIKVNLIKISLQKFAVRSLQHLLLSLHEVEPEQLYLLTICLGYWLSSIVYKFIYLLIECYSFLIQVHLKLSDIFSIFHYLKLLSLADFLFEPIVNGFLLSPLQKQYNSFSL